MSVSSRRTVTTAEIRTNKRKTRPKRAVVVNVSTPNSDPPESGTLACGRTTYDTGRAADISPLYTRDEHPSPSPQTRLLPVTRYDTSTYDRAHKQQASHCKENDPSRREKGDRR